MKTKIIIAISLILLSFMSFFVKSKDMHKMNEKKILTVGLSAEYPPFEFFQQGKIIGFDVDLIEALGQELNQKVQIKEMPFHSLIPALATGKIDMVASSMTVTSEREKNVDFSSQYYKATLGIIYLKDKKKPELNNLTHKKLGVQLGSIMEGWAKEQSKIHPDLQIIALESNPILIEKLKLHQIDYIIIEMQQAIKFCKANPSLSFQKIESDHQGYAIAFAKDSPNQTLINGALHKLEQKGVIQKLTEKWFGEQP